MTAPARLAVMVSGALSITLGCRADEQVARGRPGGISTTFPKRLELMERDSFARGSRPLSAARAVQNLTRYNAIWHAGLIAEHNRPAWRLLRRRYPQVLTFAYLSGDSVRRDRARLAYLDYDEINAKHPEWFLLSDPGDARRADPRRAANRIRWRATDPSSSDYNRFYLDVGDPAFQRWAAQRILELVSGKTQGLEYPYHGFAMDNVSIGARRMLRITAQHPNWKYAGDMEGWNAAFFAYLRTVKQTLNQAGYLLMANHTLEYGSAEDDQYWDEFLACVDGAVTEKPLGYGRHRFSGPAWVKALERHEQVAKRGVLDWWLLYPPNTEAAGYRDFLFGYCSWLLVRVPGKSLFFATRGDLGWSNPRPPWYAEYDLPLGAPAAPRYQQGACWSRDYRGAKVLVNPTREVQTVVLDPRFRWRDGSRGQAVARLRMEPLSGRILLRDAR